MLHIGISFFWCQKYPYHFNKFFETIISLFFSPWVKLNRGIILQFSTTIDESHLPAHKSNLRKNKYAIIFFKENIIKKKRENNNVFYYHSSNSASTKLMLLSEPKKRKKFTSKNWKLKLRQWGGDNNKAQKHSIEVMKSKIHSRSNTYGTYTFASKKIKWLLLTQYLPRLCQLAYSFCH